MKWLYPIIAIIFYSAFTYPSIERAHDITANKTFVTIFLAVFGFLVVEYGIKVSGDFSYTTKKGRVKTVSGEPIATKPFWKLGIHVIIAFGVNYLVRL